MGHVLQVQSACMIAGLVLVLNLEYNVLGTKPKT